MACLRAPTSNAVPTIGRYDGSTWYSSLGLLKQPIALKASPLKFKIKCSVPPVAKPFAPVAQQTVSTATDIMFSFLCLSTQMLTRNLGRFIPSVIVEIIKGAFYQVPAKATGLFSNPAFIGAAVGAAFGVAVVCCLIGIGILIGSDVKGGAVTPGPGNNQTNNFYGDFNGNFNQNNPS